jgi:DNA modification methylase
MFSFVGDTVLDPFLGTGTTTLAAARWGRNSVGFEIDSSYLDHAIARIEGESKGLFERTTVNVHRG